MPKVYEIFSKTKDDKLVCVCTTEAESKGEARRNTSRFCWAYDIKIHSVRVQGKA